MAINGQAIKQDFLVIRDNPIVSNQSFATPENQDCCFELPALAETNYTDPIKNDSHSWIQYYSAAYTTAKMYLQKYDGATYVDVEELTDNKYGTLFAFGFFETMYDEKTIGFLIDWRKVLLEEGEGDYRLKAVGTLVSGVDITTTSFEFCLREYTPNRADGTVRLTWYKNGNSGSLIDDAKKVDYGTLDWFNEIRLPSAYFGDDGSEYEDRYVKYQSGNMTPLELNQVEEYTLFIDPIPTFIHRFIKIDILQSFDIFVTDYNLNNATPHVKRKVIPSSGYTPTYTRGTMLAPVEVKFKQAIQNLTVKRS